MRILFEGETIQKGRENDERNGTGGDLLHERFAEEIEVFEKILINLYHQKGKGDDNEGESNKEREEKRYSVFETLIKCLSLRHLLKDGNGILPLFSFLRLFINLHHIFFLLLTIGSDRRGVLEMRRRKQKEKRKGEEEETTYQEEREEL